MTYTKESLENFFTERDDIDELFNVYAQEKGLITRSTYITSLRGGWFNYDQYIGCGEYEATSEHYDLADFAAWLNERKSS